MRILSFTLVSVFLSLFGYGQISHGGQPYGWNEKSAMDMDAVELPKVEVDHYKTEDAANDKMDGIPYRFGINVETDFDINNSGEWTELENGDGIWRLAIKSKYATSLNFVFDSFVIPNGSEVFIYTENKSQLLGSFTNENASKSNSLGVGLIFSDKLIIEYREPANVRGEGYLHINNVTHGYRDILVDVENDAKGPFGNSGACNINVNCPEGIPFDIQKRSVAIIVVNNNGACSGAMVNNAQQDGTPFFLTANHCLPFNENNTQNWIFYFNHETAGCSGSTGPTGQSVSGGTVLSSNAESDYALLELNDTPPASYDVCLSGWDATDSQSSVTSAYGIHHPSGDVKKICFEEDAPYHAFEGGFVNQVWFIDQWEDGVTEGGSSGSPLFNQNGLLIGQLAGGLAACSGTVNNGQHDFYGRLGVSWDFGSTPSNAIRFWLDPSNTGALIVPNSCNSVILDNNASLGSITGVSDVLCSLEELTPSVNVINQGSANIESITMGVSINGSSETLEWSGNIAPFENAFIQLETFTPSDGSNEIDIEILTVNGEDDMDELGNTTGRDFLAFENVVELTVNILLDEYPEETSWEITNTGGELLASGGPYSTPEVLVSETICLPEDCYTFEILDSAPNGGDGLCCGFGFGSYEVLNQFGEVVAEGAEFDASESTLVCLALDTTNPVIENIAFYPNPAGDSFTIAAGDSEIESVKMFDINGRLILSKAAVLTQSTIIDSSLLESGVYIVEVTASNGASAREKVVINKN